MRSIHAPFSLRLFAVLALAGGLGGCDAVKPVAPYHAPITDPTQLYMRLAADFGAVNLSTAPGYDTVQLRATPQDALGNPMAGLPAPAFTSTDTTKIRISPTGMATAVGTGTGIKVYAKLTVGPVTHVDSVLINVKNLPTPPKLGGISIHPIPPDSAIWSVPEPSVGDLFFPVGVLISALPFIDPPVLGYARGLGFTEGYRLAARATDTAGAPIAGLQVEYESLDSAIATIDRVSGRVSEPSLFPGQVRMVARTYAYGVVKADTVTFTVTTPFSASFSIVAGPTGEAVLRPQEFRIAPYGYVAWKNQLSDPVDVVFDDPTQVLSPPAPVCDGINPIYVLAFELPVEGEHCGAGNVTVPPPDPLFQFFSVQIASVFAVQLRQIKEPGVYTFRITGTGATGRVIVTNDPTGPVD